MFIRNDKSRRCLDFYGELTRMTVGRGLKSSGAPWRLESAITRGWGCGGLPCYSLDELCEGGGEGSLTYEVIH